MVFSFGKKKESKQIKESAQETEQDQKHQADRASEATSDTVVTEWIKDAQIEGQVVKKQEASSEALENTVLGDDKKSYFTSLKTGLSKTGTGLGNLFLGKKLIDDELLEDLEATLLMADIGIEATQEIIDDITDGISRKSLNDKTAVVAQLKTTMCRILQVSEKPLVFSGQKPFVLLMVGVNGAGKTTTIGKISQKLKHDGKTVMLAAGDTFRAAAAEQLKTWGKRADVPVIAQGSGADSASVIYDAYESAKAKGIDVLIADTAGRLHTQKHLMSEIEKIVRVLRKHDASAPHEVMLVVDAGNGQNALNQAKEFNQSLGLTGITVSKLDGTAKGGIVFPIAKQLGVPVRFIGVGESAQDLKDFNAKDFVDALLADLS